MRSDLQGEIRAKDQQIATLQRRYVGYLASEGKRNGINILIYLYGDSMVIEGKGSECCWQVIQYVQYVQKKIHQIPSSCISSGDSIG